MSYSNVIDQAWRSKIDLRSELRSLGIEFKEDGPWLRGRCPMHQDKTPSWAMSLVEQQIHGQTLYPGYWKCFASCGCGSLETLIARVSGWPENEVRKKLRTRYDPQPSTEVPETINEIMVQTWEAALLPNYVPHPEIALDYLKNHAINSETWKRARVGCEQSGEVVCFPVFDRDGKTILTVKKRLLGKTKAKMISGKGRGSWPYPLWMLESKTQLVVCEGEADALALHSYGVNAVTCTSGCGGWTMEMLGGVIAMLEATEVVLIADNDKAGTKAKAAFAQELKRHGVEKIRVVKFDGAKDISEWLALQDGSMRHARLQELLAQAEKSNVGTGSYGGWTDKGGEIVSEEDERVIVPWRGEVVEHGRNVSWSGQATPYLKFRITGKEGLTAEVGFKEGESFTSKLLACPGVPPSWRPETRYEDKLIVFLSKTYSNAVAKDRGWVFGFLGESLTQFWTKSSMIDADGSHPNEQMEMISPNKIFDHMDLPVIDEGKVKEGFALLFSAILGSFPEDIIIPMIVTAFASPVRRLACPEQPRWAVYLIGSSGRGKTSRALLIMSLFGAIRMNDKLPTWKDTGRSVDELLGMRGDALSLVDELKTRNVSEREGMIINQVLQGVAQGSGRTRMSNNGRDLIESGTARCPVMLTSEDLPVDDRSQLARGLVIRIPESVIGSHEPWSTPYLEATADGKLELLPHAMASWIHHWIARKDGKEAFMKRHREVTARLDTWGKLNVPQYTVEPNNTRIALRLAMYEVFWFELLEYAVTKEAITQEHSNDMKSRWMQFYAPSLFKQNIDTIAKSGVGVSISEVLSMNLSAGLAYFSNKCRSGGLGQPFPRSPSPQAIEIGVFRDDLSDELQAKCQVCIGERYGYLVLTDAAQLILSRSGVTRSWRKTIDWMEQNGLVCPSDQLPRGVRLQSGVLLTRIGVWEIPALMEGQSGQSTQSN